MQSQLPEFALATYPDSHTDAITDWARCLHKNSTFEKRDSIGGLAEGFNVKIDKVGNLLRQTVPLLSKQCLFQSSMNRLRRASNFSQGAAILAANPTVWIGNAVGAKTGIH